MTTGMRMVHCINRPPLTPDKEHWYPTC